MAIGDVYHGQWLARLVGQRVQFGLHYRVLTATGSPTGLAAAINTSLHDTLAAALSANLSFNEIMVSDTNRDGAATVHRIPTGESAGLVTGQDLPPQCACVISLRSDQKSRRRRGRMFIAGLVEESQAGGTLGAPQLGALQAFATALITAFGPNGTNPDYRAVVYSPEDLTVTPPRVGRLLTDIVSAQPQSTIFTQRRRTLGVGA